MGIRSWFKKFLTTMNKPAAVAREASGEIRVGESAYATASRRWRLYRNNALLRRIGIRFRRELAATHIFRPVTNRKHPKPCSYNNAGAGRVRAIKREQLAVAHGKKSKKAA